MHVPNSCTLGTLVLCYGLCLNAFNNMKYELEVPIGVGKKGRPVFCMKSFTGSSAWPYAAPFPTITRGRWAFASNVTASETAFGGARDDGGGGHLENEEGNPQCHTLPSQQMFLPREHFLPQPH